MKPNLINVILKGKVPSNSYHNDLFRILHLPFTWHFNFLKELLFSLKPSDTVEGKFLDLRELFKPVGCETLTAIAKWAHSIDNTTQPTNNTVTPLAELHNQ